MPRLSARGYPIYLQRYLGSCGDRPHPLLPSSCPSAGILFPFPPRQLRLCCQSVSASASLGSIDFRARTCRLGRGGEGEKEGGLEIDFCRARVASLGIHAPSHPFLLQPPILVPPSLVLRRPHCVSPGTRPRALATVLSSFASPARLRSMYRPPPSLLVTSCSTFIRIRPPSPSHRSPLISSPPSTSCYLDTTPSSVLVVIQSRPHLEILLALYFFISIYLVPT
ncbi:hypothetical protein R3P38DRAFT_1681 [Favolaschia claudopus]|uniref:Uncharacterized protein n=1 Tax=Favolaschia claudopus TaxID=2862362 RepID=A0AAW0EF17_9AGAR